MNSVKISGIHIDIRDLGNATFVTKVSPYYLYEGDERTDKVEGYKYATVFPGRNFEQLDIKIPGDKLLDVPVNQYIAANFDGLEVKLYYDKENRVRLTAKDTGVCVLEADKRH